jgi:hypothetical protein
MGPAKAERAKKKPAVEGGLESNSLRRVGGDRYKYAALAHISPIFVWHI